MVLLYISRAHQFLGIVPQQFSHSDEISRSIIRRHIGLYAHRVRYLRSFARQEVSPLEETEKLEQLRALWKGKSNRSV